MSTIPPLLALRAPSSADPTDDQVRNDVDFLLQNIKEVTAEPTFTLLFATEPIKGHKQEFILNDFKSSEIDSKHTEDGLYRWTKLMNPTFPPINKSGETVKLPTCQYGIAWDKESSLKIEIKWGSPGSIETAILKIGDCGFDGGLLGPGSYDSFGYDKYEDAIKAAIRESTDSAEQIVSFYEDVHSLIDFFASFNDTQYDHCILECIFDSAFEILKNQYLTDRIKEKRDYLTQDEWFALLKCKRIEPIYFTERMAKNGDPVDVKEHKWSAYLHVQRTAAQIIKHAKRQKKEYEDSVAIPLYNLARHDDEDARPFIETDGNVVMVEVRNYYVHQMVTRPSDPVWRGL